jgi:hypothetical protein
MTSNDQVVRPPRVGAWCVELFTSADEADAILGDLEEDFQARAAHDPAGARRRYWRQALATIRDLALAPGWRQTTSGARFRRSGLLLSLFFGVVGFAISFPVFWTINGGAGMFVQSYPVYQYVPASLFWTITFFVTRLTSGFAIAFVASFAKLRPMNVVLSAILVITGWFVLATAITLARYGQPPASWPQVTPISMLLGVGRSLLTFGVPMLIGAALCRMLMRRANRASAGPVIATTRDHV